VKNLVQFCHLTKTFLLNSFIGIVSVYFIITTSYTFAAPVYRRHFTLIDKRLFLRSFIVRVIILKKAEYSNEVDEKMAAIAVVQKLNLSAKRNFGARNFDAAKKELVKAIQLCDKFHIDSLKGDCWLIFGAVDQRRGEYKLGIQKYLNAILFYQKQNKILHIAIANLDIGICKQQLSLFNDAINFYLQAGYNFEKLNDHGNLANTYNSIALCFISLGNYPKAIAYNRKALSIRRILKDSISIAQSLNNIGFAFKEFNQPDSAIYYLNKCLVMRGQPKDSSILVLNLQNLGSTLKLKGEYSSAERYILRSLRIAAKYHMPEELADGNLDLAELYLATNRYKDALAAAKITEATARTLKLPELLMKAYAAEYLIEERLKDYKSALYYSAKQAEIKDSLFSVAKDRTFNELEIKYQAAQKEKDIKALNVQNTLQGRVVGQQRLFIVVLIPVSVLLLVLFIVAYRNYLQKTKATKKIQLLNAELNHRVKNNLQILSGLFTMQIDNLADEKTRDALRENETRLASMNLIHNKLYLDHSTTQIEMRDYLTKLLYHIKESFGGDKTRTIKLKLDLDNLNVEADKAVAIGLIVNELATNAFKYAFDDDGGEISLTLKQSGKTKILLTLSDNGKGLPAENKDKPPSFGLRLVNLLTRQLHTTMSVKSGQGTSYQMEIAL
jgi:two-component sensor histidine kinase